MIGVKPQGRLGNQLFQYAFAYSQAKKHKTLFFIDKGFPPLHVYSLEKYFKLRRGEKLLIRIAKILHWRYFSKQKNYKELFQLGNEPVDSILKQSNKNVFWDGYFQSQDYFSPYQKAIKKCFELKREYKNLFYQKYGRLFEEKKVLVLHIRRTDYLDWGSEALGGKNLTLPMLYYENCLSMIENLENYHIIVLSDDIEFVKEYFANRPNFHYEHNEEIVDLQLITHAHALITSNSTFAWWGAFLNKNSAAKIFAPKYWLGFKVNKEFPVGITSLEKFTLISIL